MIHSLRRVNTTTTHTRGTRVATTGRSPANANTPGFLKSRLGLDMTNATATAAGRPQARVNRAAGPTGAKGAFTRPAAAEGTRSGPELGNAVKSSCNVSEAGENARRKRWRLRDKMKRYANRTLVPTPARVVSFAVDEMTGEVLVDKAPERADRPAEDRFLACGSRSVTAFGAVGIKFDGSRAGYSGLAACGSAWSCTVCAAKIQQQRAADLTAVTTWARRNKKTVAMVTFTIRHKKRDPLTAVWDAVAAGWGSVTAGKDWVSEKPEKFAERLDRWEAAVWEAREGRGRMPRNGRKYLDALGWPGSHDDVVMTDDAAACRPQRRVGDQERYGLMGWARAAEATHGANGWHVHLHVLMVLDPAKDGGIRGAGAAGLAERMWSRYAAGIATVTDDKGDPFTADKEHGMNLRVSVAAEKRLAEYLAKDGLMDSPEKVRASVDKAGKKAAMETALGAGKKGRKAGRTPFQILDAIDQANPGADLAVWREWVVGSMGRRQLTTSAGWRELANLPDEKTDEEIAAEEACGDLVLHLPAATWEALKADRLRPLELTESAGVDGVIEYLTGLGLAFKDMRPGAAEDDDASTYVASAPFGPEQKPDAGPLRFSAA